uniref:Secreted protein n=1 Tax=Glossina palpalis gambiensis TaxID=67801 RepID=A0A1B0APR9_9MUSC
MPMSTFCTLLTQLMAVGHTFVIRSARHSNMNQMLRDNKQHNLPQTIEKVLKQNCVIRTIPANKRNLASLPEVIHVQFLVWRTYNLSPNNTQCPHI